MLPSAGFFSQQNYEESLLEHSPVDISNRLNSPASQADIIALRAEISKIRADITEFWHSGALLDIRTMRALRDTEAQVEGRLIASAQQNVVVASEVAHELDGEALYRESVLQKRIEALESTITKLHGQQAKLLKWFVVLFVVVAIAVFIRY